LIDVDSRKEERWKKKGKEMEKGEGGGRR